MSSKNKLLDKKSNTRRKIKIMRFKKIQILKYKVRNIRSKVEDIQTEHHCYPSTEHR